MSWLKDSDGVIQPSSISSRSAAVGLRPWSPSPRLAIPIRRSYRTRPSWPLRCDHRWRPSTHARTVPLANPRRTDALDWGPDFSVCAGPRGKPAGSCGTVGASLGRLEGDKGPDQPVRDLRLKGPELTLTEAILSSESQERFTGAATVSNYGDAER